MSVAVKETDAKELACKCRGSGTSRVSTPPVLLSPGVRAHGRGCLALRDLSGSLQTELIPEDFHQPRTFLYAPRMGGFQNRDTLRIPLHLQRLKRVMYIQLQTEDSRKLAHLIHPPEEMGPFPAFVKSGCRIHSEPQPCLRTAWCAG